MKRNPMFLLLSAALIAFPQTLYWTIAQSYAGGHAFKSIYYFATFITAAIAVAIGVMGYRHGLRDTVGAVVTGLIFYAATLILSAWLIGIDATKSGTICVFSQIVILCPLIMGSFVEDLARRPKPRTIILSGSQADPKPVSLQPGKSEPQPQQSGRIIDMPEAEENPPEVDENGLIIIGPPIVPEPDDLEEPVFPAGTDAETPPPMPPRY